MPSSLSLRAAVISIHALREEGDHFNRPHPVPVYVFLSTPSARRATQKPARVCCREPISIHALREEGDCGRLWR